MIRSGDIDESRRLSHVDGFIEVALEKGVVDIQLSYRPTASDDNGENDSNGCWFDHKAECFHVVNPGSLVKALCKKPCFVAVDTNVCLLLDPKHPFVTNYVLSWWSGDVCCCESGQRTHLPSRHATVGLGGQQQWKQVQYQVVMGVWWGDRMCVGVA